MKQRANVSLAFATIVALGWGSVIAVSACSSSSNNKTADTGDGSTNGSSSGKQLRKQQRRRLHAQLELRQPGQRDVCRVRLVRSANHVLRHDQHVLLGSGLRGAHQLSADDVQQQQRAAGRRRRSRRGRLRVPLRSSGQRGRRIRGALHGGRRLLGRLRSGRHDLQGTRATAGPPAMTVGTMAEGTMGPRTTVGEATMGAEASPRM